MKSKIVKDFGDGYYITLDQIDEEYEPYFTLRKKVKCWFDRTILWCDSLEGCGRHHKQILINSNHYNKEFD